MFLGFRVDQPGSVLLSCGIRSEHAFKDEVVQRSFRMICGTTQKGRINMQIQVAHSPIFLVKVVNSNGFGALVNIAHTSIRCIDDCCYCSLSPNQHFVLATSATSWTWFYHTSGGWFVFFGSFLGFDDFRASLPQDGPAGRFPDPQAMSCRWCSRSGGWILFSVEKKDGI
jgi:hypothetical protein